MAKRTKKKQGIFICIVAAAVSVLLICGIVTIGAMNLLATDELYTVYTTAFTANSVITGLAVFGVTAAVCTLVFLLSRFKRAFIVILTLAFLARLAAALLWHIEPESDFFITYDLAGLLARTPVTGWGAALDAYGTSYNTIWSAHMPFIVYQSLLLRLWNNADVLRIFNALFSSGTCLLLVSTAGSLGGDTGKRIALTAAAFNPALIFMLPVLTNQHAAQFFFVLGVFLFFTLNGHSLFLRSALAGLCLGISQLLRPEMWVVVIAAAVYVIYSELRSKVFGKRLAVYAVGLCIFMSVTVAANTFLTTSHVIHGNIYNGNLNYKLMVGLNPETNGSWSAKDSRLEGNDKAINTVIASRLRSDPLTLVPRLFGKAVYQLGTYVYTWCYKSDQEWISQIIMRRSGAALMITVCALAAFKLLRRRRDELLWVYITLLGYAAFYALTEVQGRYSMSFIPLLVLICSA